MSEYIRQAENFATPVTCDVNPPILSVIPFLLKCIKLNDKSTGIVGYVPAYNTNHRISKLIRMEVIHNEELITILSNYIAEVGMDFNDDNNCNND